VLVDDPAPHVVRFTFNKPDKLNAADVELHAEMSRMFELFDADEAARVAVVTGAGRAFSAGGDFQMIKEMTGNWALVVRELYDTRRIVTSMCGTDKPIVSAINGPAVGAGLAVALLADVSVVGESVRLTDGHTRFGVAAGDHSVLLWPLLCGMARAKYYLLTSEFVDGKKAAEIGLVSMAVPDAQVMDKALEVASRLASGPQMAIRFTKRALNGWLSVFMPAFEHSLALEMLTFLGPDPKEGAAALQEKRPPRFPEPPKP
jgi:enoyl-CoA hydratase